MKLYNERLIAGASVYGELLGGAGDALLRLYFTGKSWYNALFWMPPGEYAVFSLMCHNPYLFEIFAAHPCRYKIHLIDLGFTTPFHPWENKEWRVGNGLPPESPCPPHDPADSLQFFPLPEDTEVMESVLSGGRFIIMSATAGAQEKNIPPHIQYAAADAAIESGFSVVVVGRSRYKKDGAWNFPKSKSVVDLTDKLSMPGTLELVKAASGVVTADTMILHASWKEGRPVFLLYNDWTKENLVSRGAVGYMHGINNPGTDHMTFSAYKQDLMRAWLKERK